MNTYVHVLILSYGALEYKSETSITATCIHVGLLYKNFFIFTLQLTFVLEKM